MVALWSGVTHRAIAPSVTARMGGYLLPVKGKPSRVNQAISTSRAEIKSSEDPELVRPLAYSMISKTWATMPLPEFRVPV